MFQSWKLIFGVLSLAVFAAGCQTQTAPSTTASSSQGAHDQADDSHDHGSGPEQQTDNATEKKVSAVLAKLSAEDREIAETQRFCAVMNHERLGGMGTPLKLSIKGQPVFVCCKGCRDKALKKPDETLAKLADLRSKSSSVQP